MNLLYIIEYNNIVVFYTRGKKAKEKNDWITDRVMMFTLVKGVHKAIVLM